MDRGSLGRNLREIRLGLGLSLTDVARETDMSSSFLSLVESGKSDIAISRLVRLAEHLGVEVGDLVAGATDHPPIKVVAPQEGSSFESADEGVRIHFLSHAPWRMAAEIVEYEPQASVLIDQTAKHEALVHVLAGRFEIRVADEEPKRLGRGYTALLQSERALEVTNIGNRVGRLLVVGLPAEA